MQVGLGVVKPLPACARASARNRNIHRIPPNRKWESTAHVGKLLYGTSRIEIEFADRTLAHLHPVIGTKLRRHEGFFFSWRDDPALGDGRSSIWIDTAIPLYFSFDTSERHALNRDWLEALSQSSNSAEGLMLVPEPGTGLTPPRSNV